MRLDDLRGDTCLWCDEPLPDERRADQVYCSRRCQGRHYWSFESDAIRESKQGRTCAHCRKPISVERQASAIYCDEVCRSDAARQGAAAQRRRTLPLGRACALCGSPIPERRRLDAVFCCTACQMRARRRRPAKPCQWCGGTFAPRKASNTYCGRSCAARARMHRLRRR